MARTDDVSQGDLSSPPRGVLLDPPCLSCLGDRAPEINAVVYSNKFFMLDYSWPKIYILMILVAILYGMTD